MQAQQRNNQLALDRLDDYEETISQLQEELHQLRSSKKKENCTDNNLEKDRLLTEERINELQEKNVHMEKNLTEQFERERDNLLDQLRARDEHIDKLQQWKNEQGKGQLEFDEEHRFKELQVREMLERRLIELSEDLQALESDKHELEQQLQSKDRLIQTFQVSNRIDSWMHRLRTEHLTIRFVCHTSELHHDTWFAADDGYVIRRS